jgi:hypothetical protein
MLGKRRMFNKVPNKRIPDKITLHLTVEKVSRSILTAFALYIATVLVVPKNKVEIKEDGDICTLLLKDIKLSEIEALAERYEIVKERISLNIKISPSDYLFFKNYRSIINHLLKSIKSKQQSCEFRFNSEEKYLEPDN